MLIFLWVRTQVLWNVTLVGWAVLSVSKICSTSFSFVKQSKYVVAVARTRITRTSARVFGRSIQLFACFIGWLTTSSLLLASSISHATKLRMNRYILATAFTFRSTENRYAKYTTDGVLWDSVCSRRWFFVGESCRK